MSITQRLGKKTIYGWALVTAKHHNKEEAIVPEKILIYGKDT